MAGERGAAQQRNRLAPFNDFLSAARAVVRLLHPRLGYGLLMVTRIEGDRMRVMAVVDTVYGLREEDELSWSHSLCRAVAEGVAPPIATDITGVPGLAEAADKEAEAGRPVRSHMGLALMHPDGSLYGTICAADPQPRRPDIADELPLFELTAQLLSTVLAGDAKTASEVRRAELAEEESLVDGLTGLSNRRAWDRHLEIEENRSRRYGIPTSVVVVDLDHLKEVNDSDGHAAGDFLLRLVAETLEQCSRDPDICSRTGGDEFAILAVDCDETAADALAERVEEALAEKQVHASLGWATRHPITGLQEAVRRADQGMFEAKRNKR
ncbi:MAG: sensor domain-containing diguanylate cyclase [Actinomycetota bacterium]|nr:sensor domain-containing diguanylate cyclase [Actinomycetota bacterium]